MSYTEVFGGNTIYPSDVSYLAVALTGDIEFEWPIESAAPEYPLARIIDVIANGPHMMRLPDATIAAPGETVLFNVLTASSSECFVEDHLGNTIATLGVGEQWELYLTDNTTVAGEWQVFHFGASTATVQPSALAGYGITVTGSTLSQSVPVTTFNASPRTVIAGDRASALVWVGAGSATLDLPGVATVGNNYFFSARNAGGGMLNLDPSGSEVIDGLAAVALSPGEGVVLVTDGLVWYTLGRGQAAIFAFDYTAIDLTGKPSPYVLSGSELNRISYKFTGALTHNVIVVVPSTVQQYWVDNSTTGAFTLALNTAGGSPVVVPQGSRGIYYCNGVSIVDADTSTGIALPVNASDGGTGQTSYVTGDLLTASNPATLARLAAAPVGNALIAKGAGVMPEWGDVDLTNTVVGVLPPANGGTGSNLAAFVPGYHVKGGPAGQLLSSPLVYDNGTNVGIGTATPGKRLSITGGGMAFDEVGGAVRGIHWGDGANYPVTVNGDASTGALYFNTAPAGTAVSIERMRITSAGFVGVGTGTPSALLDVNGTAKAPQFLVAGTSAFYLGNHPTFGPIVNFDANDYISYDTAGDVMSFAIGGVQKFRINAAGVYTPGSVAVGDGNHSLYIQSGAPTYAWDANDYQFYDRAANAYNIVIGGVNRFNISPTVINLGGAVNMGTINCTGITAQTHAISGTTGNPYITASDSTHVLINFDSNDYIMFDQTTNNMGFTVGGANGFNVATGYTLHPDGVGARFGDNNMVIYKSGTTGVIAFDANDYLQFNRTTNQWDFWLGGTIQLSIYGGGVSARTAMITPIIWIGGLSDCYINAGGDQMNINPDTNDGLIFYRSLNQWRFTINGNAQAYIDAAGLWTTNNIRPNVTNTMQSGDTSYAWFNCSAYQYVNPGDAREKNWRGAATTPELTAARRITDELGFYSWKEGPSNGKLQFGLRAQSLARILMEEGVEATQSLDYESGVFVPEGERPAFEYGLVEFASWEDQFMGEAADSGKEPELVQAAGNRFAVNHDQLSMFLIAAQAKQIEALEARLAAAGL